MQMTQFKDRMLLHRAQDKSQGKSGAWAMVGLVLMGVGVLVLWGWEATMLMSAAEVPMVLKVGVGLVGFGLTIAFAVVCKERLETRSSDRYLEVDR